MQTDLKIARLARQTVKIINFQFLILMTMKLVAFNVKIVFSIYIEVQKWCFKSSKHRG